MKEATGELNMTVVTVVAIAAIGAFFYAFVWPAIQASIKQSTRCSNAVGCDCSAEDTCQCSYYLDDGTISTEKITCPNPSYNENDK